MIKVAVIEDDGNYASKLKRRLLKADFQEKISVDIYLRPQDFIDVLQKGKRYELCFSDVVMPDMDGITLAEEAHKVESRMLVIFLSSWSEYAMDGYNVNAFGYLTKDRMDDGWDTLIGRINRHLEESREKTYRICTQNSVDVVQVNDIIYVFKEGNYCHFVLADKEAIQVRKSMWKLQEELAVYKHFILIKKGCIINIRKIQKFKGKEVVMINGTVITIGRMHMEIVKEKVMEYMGGTW